MRYFTMLVLFVLIGTRLTFGEYITPGNGSVLNLDNLVSISGGAVTKINGRYFFNSDLTVSLTDTLAINTDETLVIDSAKTLTFLGVLHAEGIEGITILPKDTLNLLSIYKELRFDGTVSRLKKVDFLYGGGLKILDSQIEIDSCVFRGNSKKYNSSAVTASSSRVKILHSKFIENQRAAVGSAANITNIYEIIGNFFKNNSTTNENYPQINLGPGIVNDTIKIVDNIIEGLYIKAGAIAISNLMGVSGNTNYLIDNNIITGNRYGITAIGKNIYGIISRNLIADNNIQNLPMQGGSGISLQLTSSSPADTTLNAVIRQNVIKNNLWGITVIGKARADLSEGYNSFENNSNGGQIYNLYNNTVYPISATHNYWGFTDSTLIENTIFHQNDLDSLGLVTFMPFLNGTHISDDGHTAKTEALLSNYPNPFNPTTVINYRLNSHGIVKLSIFNSRGEQVQILVNGLQKAGRYWVNFDGKGLNSGVYFYRLESDGRSLVNKMILCK